MEGQKKRTFWWILGFTANDKRWKSLIVEGPQCCHNLRRISILPCPKVKDAYKHPKSKVLLLFADEHMRHINISGSI